LKQSISVIYTNKYKQRQYITGPNIAFGNPTRQYPGVFDNGTPDKAVDGVKENGGASGVCAHTGQGNATHRAWWTVDLGDEYRVTGIKIVNRDLNSKFLYTIVKCQIFLSHYYDVTNLPGIVALIYVCT